MKRISNQHCAVSSKLNTIGKPQTNVDRYVYSEFDI